MIKKLIWIGGAVLAVGSLVYYGYRNRESLVKGAKELAGKIIVAPAAVVVEEEALVK